MAIKLVHSRKYEALYKSIDEFFRCLAVSDGVESIFNDAMKMLVRICSQSDFAQIKLAFTEQGEILTPYQLSYLAQANCTGCENELIDNLHHFEKQHNQDGYIDMLLALAFIENQEAYATIEEICEGNHWIKMVSFWITFEGIEDIKSTCSKALILKYGKRHIKND